MKFSRIVRRTVGLISAYALALQPLIASLTWVAHAASLVPGQAVICRGAVPGGNDGRGLPAKSHKVCGCCMAANCGTMVGTADFPPTISVFAPAIGQRTISVAVFAVPPQAMPSERYCPRAPPAA
jgi:hypothetical protein